VRYFVSESALSPGLEPYERRKQMKYTIVIILGKALSLMLMGLAYLMLRRSLRTWFQ
jgi:hypothetical protein